MSGDIDEEREFLRLRDDGRRVVRGEIERGRGRRADEERVEVGANDRVGGERCENGKTLGAVQGWEDFVGGVVFEMYRRL